MLKPRYLGVESPLEGGDWRLVNVSDAGVLFLIAWEYHSNERLMLEEGYVSMCKCAAWIAPRRLEEFRVKENVLLCPA